MNRIETSKLYRVTRKTALTAYKQGKTIRVLPCKVHPENVWIRAFTFSRETYKGKFGYNETDNNREFELIMNAYEYYNCNDNETGKYPAYYLEKGV